MNKLLQTNEPTPVELVNSTSDLSTVLVCEHAGNRVPTTLNGLGLSENYLSDHIGWDIGAAAVTRHLASHLGVRAILQRYSRLVIDCNRPTTALDSIPGVSHDIAVPANQDLSSADRQRRIEEIFSPFDDALNSQLSVNRCKVAISIHSFTPILNGQQRPWDVGFLFRKDSSTSAALAKLLHSAHPELNIGMNEPYAIDDTQDWFVPQYGEKRRLIHSLIEIRNDHLRTEQGQLWWSRVLAHAITQLLTPLPTPLLEGR